MAMAMATFLLYILLMPLLVVATAQVNYPLDQQFPPVAHVGSPFSFQFAPTTFSGSPALHYSLIGNPPWLSLNEESRTLVGTPRPSDAGFITFNITATGSDGTAASMESKLFVTTGNAPVAKANLSDALSTAGQLNGPNTVTLKPSKPFIITFPSDTFVSNETLLSYFATLSDHTPLPAWIRFDSPSMRFAGISMPTTKPQSAEILLIASDIPGFATSSLSFTLTTSVHTLSFKPFSQTINATKGQELHIADLRQKLFLDDSLISDSNLQSASAIIPSWLTFDKETFAISGVAPANTTSRDLVIIAQDQFGDMAEHTIHLLFESEIFASSFENLDITLGDHFSYNVPRTILARGGENITINFATLAGYLTFDPSTFTIAGTIPSSFAPQHVECSVTATSADGRSHDTQSFFIEVSKASNYSQPGVIGSLNTEPRVTKTTRNGIIAGSVFGGLLIALLLIVLAIFLCRKRRGREIDAGRKKIKNPQKSEISRPMPIPDVWPDNGIELNTEDDLEKGKDIYDSYLERTPETPPRLDLDLAAHPKVRTSATESIGDISTRILDIFEESPYGIQNDTSPSQHPHDSMKLATELAKQGSRRGDHFRKHKRRTTTVYQDQIHRSTGLPVHRRITGMGHGRQTYSPSRSNTHFSSNRRPMSASSYTTRGTSILSIASSTFPQSPAARKRRTFVKTPTEDRCSIRVVPSSRRSSLKDRRTADEKRSAYLRNRASADSPFFSGGFRASSSTYTSPPAFLQEIRSPTRNALSNQSCNITVRPEDSPLESKKNGLSKEMEHINAMPALVASSSQEFPGSLRQYRTTHPHTSITSPRNRVGKAYHRPDTTGGGGFSSHHRRTSTRQSLRAYDLKASLNDLTGSKVFEKADMTESIYSAEERDIEEAEQQKTVTLSQFTLPPLNLDKVDTTRSKKRNGKSGQKKIDVRDSNKDLKRTSERDPTPYFFLLPNQEHGGKENATSSYNMGHTIPPVKSEVEGKGRVLSTSEQPKSRLAQRACTAEMRKSPGIGKSRTSKPVNLQRDSIQERQSRGSMRSSTPCRQSTGFGSRKRTSNKAQSTPSRPQSSAYPYFESPVVASINVHSSPNRLLPSLPTQATNPVPSNTYIGASANSEMKPNAEESTMTMRDRSGNLALYGTDEEPTIEQLDSSSIAFCSHNGTISSTVRESRLASLHLSSQSPPPPPKSEKRKTLVAANSPGWSGGSTALSFFPQEMPGYGRREKAVQAEREESVNVGSRDGEADGEEQPKTAWGNLRTALGKSGKWVGGGYWEGRGKDEKVFI